MEAACNRTKKERCMGRKTGLKGEKNSRGTDVLIGMAVRCLRNDSAIP